MSSPVTSIPPRKLPPKPSEVPLRISVLDNVSDTVDISIIKDPLRGVFALEHLTYSGEEVGDLLETSLV